MQETTSGRESASRHREGSGTATCHREGSGTATRRGASDRPVRARVRGALAVAALVAATAAAGAAPARAQDELTPVLATVLARPAVVPQSDGLWKVPYELELTNVTDAPMTIESVDVLTPDRDGNVVTSLAAAAVAANLSLPGSPETTTLGPGQSAVLFVNLSFAERAKVPSKIAHRVTLTTTKPGGPLHPRTVEHVAATGVDTAAPIVVSPPLRGERWVAEASCCDSYHRRAVLPVNGRRYLAQRFAIDWLRLEADHRLVNGDPSRNESYPQFGAEALAVADATVVHVRDGLPEGTPGALPPTISIEDADGNSVVLDLGGGRFALYAHFQPGSIRVKPGDRVKRGDVIGLVGNTGNSSAPHLHFHVMDGPSPLGSNGVPWTIDRFEVTGRAESTSDLDDELKTPNEPVEVSPVPGPAPRTNELPADLAVVTFER